MADAIENMSHDEFVTYLPIPGIFTDAEIADKIGSYYPHASAKERLELAQAALKLKGPGGITGPIRTALRIINGLPPIEGD